jgi:hypothetical protein
MTLLVWGQLLEVGAKLHGVIINVFSLFFENTPIIPLKSIFYLSIFFLFLFLCFIKKVLPLKPKGNGYMSNNEVITIL